MHWWHGANVFEALQQATIDMAYWDDPDFILNIETHALNTVISADACTMGELNIGKHLFLNKQRWSRLIREYVPLAPLQRFIEDCRTIYTGESRDGATANMFFRDPPRTPKKHRWGGCLMGAVFHSNTITLHSRCTYMGYIGLLDAAIACKIAEYIADDPAGIRFEWHIGSAMLHHFKSIPFLLHTEVHDDIKGQADVSRDDHPALYHMQKWYRKMVEAYSEHGPAMLDHEKYGPFKRIKRRWMEYMGHHGDMPPDLYVRELSFEKAE